MEQLKTDYVDDVLNTATNTARKYKQTSNSDGTVTLKDETVYSQQGDVFGALEINKITKTVNAIMSTKTATLTVGGWSSTLPYTQKIQVAGVLESDEPIVSIYLPGDVTSANAKAQNKAYGYVDKAVTSDGNITFYCYNKKPSVDFHVQIKGV